MSDELFCPVHGDTQASIKDIKVRQDTRKCLTHESDILHLKETVGEIKLENTRQWTSIDNLRRLVYMGAGATAVLAFLGSVLGAVLKK